jgi:lipopolysaccharide heptosyltransferase I
MKVLIVRLSAIGDVIHTIPSLVALKETFPEWRICWLVEDTSAPLLQGHPYLEELLVIQRPWKNTKLSVKAICSDLKEMYRVWRVVRAGGFDVVLDFQGLLKSGLWSWLSGARRRICHGRTRELAGFFSNERVGHRPARDVNHSIIERNLELAEHLGADIRRARYLLPAPDPESVRQADLLLPDDPKPFLAICPFSTWETKNWPLENWRRLTSDLADRFRILLVGSNKDRAAAAAIAAAGSGAVDLTGRTSLDVLGEVLRRCRIVVGSDSGPAHLATAVGGPRVLMLFGATPWRRTGPFGEQHRVLSLELECQPCLQRTCPLGHLNCLRSLTPEMVLQAISEMTQSPACPSQKPKT